MGTSCDTKLSVKRVGFGEQDCEGESSLTYNCFASCSGTGAVFLSDTQHGIGERARKRHEIITPPVPSKEIF